MRLWTNVLDSADETQPGRNSCPEFGFVVVVVVFFFLGGGGGISEFGLYHVVVAFEKFKTQKCYSGRQRGRVVSASNLKSGCPGFKSRSDH